MRLLSLKHSLFALSGLAIAHFALPHFFATPAYAQETPTAQSAAQPELSDQDAGTTETESKQEKLDALFSELARERNEAKADRISRRIWRLWFESGSKTVDLLMSSAQSAVETRQFSVAMDLLDQILVLQPDYAEGWNRRATLHFMLQENGKSIRDIEQTLRLEPRHFGALAGLGGILLDQGDRERALEIYLRALEIYPMMRGAQAAVAQITEQLASEKL